jgi:hypothetical protein
MSLEMIKGRNEKASGSSSEVPQTLGLAVNFT